MEYVAWVGAICFAVCGIPQAWQSVKDGHSNSLSWSFLGLWFTGEVTTMAYIIPKGDIPLIFNYVCNFLCLLVMMHYKIWSRK